MIKQSFFKRIFFFVEDESDFFYNPSTKNQNIRMEKEETKGRFLVYLLENKGYDLGDVKIDFEGPKCEILGSVDLVAFKNDQPFLIAQFLRNKPSLAEIASARESLWEKMKDLKPQKGVLVWGDKKEVFSFILGKIKMEKSGKIS